MSGWRFVFLQDVGVPAELPTNVPALLVQQRRWAQGGIQTARKILPTLFRTDRSWGIKREAAIHLCGHLAHPLTLVLGLVIFPAAIARRHLGIDRLWWLDLFLFAAATGPFVAFYLAAARKRGRAWGRAARSVVGTLALGIGLTVSVSRAVLRGLRSTGDGFERTPKLGDASWSDYASAVSRQLDPLVALGVGTVMAGSGLAALLTGFWASVPFIALFAFGYLSIGIGGVTLSGVAKPAPNEQEPHRRPDGPRGPGGLDPDPGRLVAGQSPVSQEYEAA